jgi:C4-dicarboxylate-specific signal transduction histidine kinase
LPGFIARLTAHFTEEKNRQQADLEKLAGHFLHIRDIIITQQSSARMLGMAEDVPPLLLIEDALRLNAQSFERHGIQVEKNFAVTGSVHADRHKVLQILVNLFRNAKDALHGRDDARITLTIAPAGVTN